MEKKIQINVNIINKLKNSKVYVDEPMSKHTSFKTGGTADYFIIVSDIEDLKLIIKETNKINVTLTIIGNGSNVLVKDKGIRGIVVKLNFMETEITKFEEYSIIEVGAGVPIAKISRVAKENSLTGLEFACGIPGTIGGAIMMNAGAYKGEMKDIIVSTTYMDKEANLFEIDNKAHNFGYRTSIFSNNEYIIVKSRIKLKKGKIEEIEKQMQENMSSRNAKQPINFPNAGSTFKRGNDFVTAKLIDECGLKGYSIGGAMVSKLHAGFIINEGNATSNDIINLANHVKDEVYNKTGKKIELEIGILGE